MNSYLSDNLARFTPGLQATAVIAFPGKPTIGDAIAITANGTLYTFVCGPNSDFNSPDGPTAARNLANTINLGKAPAASGIAAIVYPFYAMAVNNNLLLISRAVGTDGNNITITTTSASIVVPASFTGGSNTGGSKTVVSPATPGANSTVAYTAGYVLGGLLTFANAVDNSLSGILQSMTVVLKDVQTTGLKLTLFSANPTLSTFTDHAAPVINAADVAKVLGTFTLGAADSTLGTYTSYMLNAIGKSLTLPGTTLYGVLTVVNTPTLATTADIALVQVGVAQD
jgi:hypothetical protein